MPYIHLIRILFLLLLAPFTAAADDDRDEPVPVILDTDIGDDIDDTWALGLLLKSPGVDIKLVLGTWGKHLYRARLNAKFLEAAGRSDIPVGIGPNRGGKQSGRQSAWLGDYKLAQYPGPVHQDGIQVMIDTIMQSPVPVTVLAIGPLANIGEALRREPRIANNARFISMVGSLHKDYAGNTRRFREYNAHADANATRLALTAAWPVIITPSDSVGQITLTGRDYRRVRNSDDPIARAIIENYRVWLKPAAAHLIEEQSTSLFDSLAIHLATSDDFARIEPLRLRVTSDGHTVFDDKAPEIQVATGWKNLAGFKKTISKLLADPAESNGRSWWSRLGDGVQTNDPLVRHGVGDNGWSY